MSKRFTERDEFGNADIIGVGGADLQLSLEFDELNAVTDALNRLATLEDILFDESGVEVFTIDRLREKQERETGCEYCGIPESQTAYNKFFKNMSKAPCESYYGIAQRKKNAAYRFHIEIEDDDDGADISINNCPMCGRRLEVRQDESK